MRYIAQNLHPHRGLDSHLQWVTYMEAGRQARVRDYLVVWNHVRYLGGIF